MAVSIEELSTSPAAFVTTTSRYIDSKVIAWSDQKITTFNTYKKTVVDTTEADKFTVVSPGEEYRPDLTSFRAYGTVDFWWRIMEANSIFDIFDYKSGTNIRIPSSLLG